MAVQKPTSLLEESFIPSLAIFTPFTGFTSDTAPSTEPTKIAENVTAQQALVRGQIVSMIETRAKSLVSKAEAEIAALGPTPEEEEEPNASEMEKRKRESDEMIQRLRASMKPDRDPKEYIYRSGVKFVEEKSNGKDADGDISMDGSTTLFRPSRPTARQIYHRLGLALQELTDQGVAQLEGYDRHAERVLRGLGPRSGYPQVASPITGSISGILKNRHVSSPVDGIVNVNPNPNVRRTSTGMPISGAMGPPERRRESIEELVRRSSR